MLSRIRILIIVALLTLSCDLAGNVSTSPTTAPVNLPSPVISTETEAATQTETLAPATDTPASTPTSAIPAGVVAVDTFDQEVAPFVQNGNCSLGEAIWAVQAQENQDGCVVVPGNSTIYLPTGTYTLTEPDSGVPPLPGSGGRLGFGPGGFEIIYRKVTILGNGSTIQRTGPNKFGIFQVTAQGDLTLNDLTLSGGDTTDIDIAEGGALDIFIGQVTLNHVTVTGNQSYQGGGLAIGVNSTVILNNSVVQGNTATSDGGGIYTEGTLIIKNSTISSNVAQDMDFGGGGIYNDGGQVTMDDSHLLGNQAREGGGIYNDGGMVNIIDQSVVSGNIATEKDSFIPHGGGGINSIASSGSSASVTIDDSFIIGNQGVNTSGGGIYNQAALTITNSVLAGNISGGGGGIFVDSEGTGSVHASCIFQNRVIGVSPDGLGNGIDGGGMEEPFDASGNWWGSASGPGIAVAGSIKSDSPLSAAPDICSSAIPTAYPTPPGE